MNKAVLLLGSNIADRRDFLEEAMRKLEKRAGKITRHSALYETAPWGNTKQEAFFNVVIILETTLVAGALLQTIISIEEQMGRKRALKWGPRIIDIDILFFNEEIILSEALSIPHPQLHLRRFTLEPMAELLPGFIHPVLKKSIAALLDEVEDPLAVKKISAGLAW